MVAGALIARTARAVLADLGLGHSEAVYQRAMVGRLARAGVPALTEVPVPFFCDGLCVGHGRVDILLDTHVVELKVTHAAPRAAMAHQLARYAAALRDKGGPPRGGVLICFNQARAAAQCRFYRHTTAKLRPARKRR